MSTKELQKLLEDTLHELEPLQGLYATDKPEHAQQHAQDFHQIDTGYLLHRLQQACSSPLTEDEPDFLAGLESATKSAACLLEDPSCEACQ